MARGKPGQGVPDAVRAAVIERDGQACRICGQWVREPVGLHHITFRSQGGRDTPDNLVVIGWLPGHDCHRRFAHGPDALLWRELLKLAIAHPGVSAASLRRWYAAERDLRLPTQRRPAPRTPRNVHR